MLRKTQCFCWPIYCNVFNLGPSWSNWIVEIGSLIHHVKHLSEHTCNVDWWRKISEKFGRLPFHAARKDYFFCEVNQIFHFLSFFRRILRKLMPYKSRFHIWLNKVSALILIDLLSTVLDELEHLVTSLHESLSGEKRIWHMLRRLNIPNTKFRRTLYGLNNTFCLFSFFLNICKLNKIQSSFVMIWY